MLPEKTDPLGRLREFEAKDLVATARIPRLRIRPVNERSMDSWAERHQVPPPAHTVRRWRHRLIVRTVVATLVGFGVVYAAAGALFVWVLGGGS